MLPPLPVDDRESPVIYADLAAWQAAHRVGRSPDDLRAQMARRADKAARAWARAHTVKPGPVPAHERDGRYNANRDKERHDRNLKGFRPGR